MFSQKQLMSLKFRILQTIRLITQMIHSKKCSDILRITLVLQIQKVKVLIQILPSSSEVIRLIKALNVKKSSQKSDIPTKILKLNADIFGNFICENFNYCLKIDEFPCFVKHADVIPVHEK